MPQKCFLSPLAPDQWCKGTAVKQNKSYQPTSRKRSYIYFPLKFETRTLLLFFFNKKKLYIYIYKLRKKCFLFFSNQDSFLFSTFCTKTFFNLFSTYTLLHSLPLIQARIQMTKKFLSSFLFLFISSFPLLPLHHKTNALYMWPGAGFPPPSFTDNQFSLTWPRQMDAVETAEQTVCCRISPLIDTLPGSYKMESACNHLTCQTLPFHLAIIGHCLMHIIIFLNINQPVEISI